MVDNKGVVWVPYHGGWGQGIGNIMIRIYHTRTHFDTNIYVHTHCSCMTCM